ncbi:MAG TPA: radical SAM family heme chaperone HemW [Firmicutes bacterium]|uniref:Heme chaperone HemW n=1 Tax=Capillibacterium thermochitinicola TaxID=2699427 RepID=A0A8J6LHT8_9FIRM|nr:radical SAM family heme chaperone HemW [Capillibacterium thermochitinicola]MBA2132590.1 radical SAM family heme chaperone HemW [Capillibacterium thermochitinicola]HHW11851.1 radical SAM family heme chaperone HemW [Bacillota bacterium]
MRSIGLYLHIPFCRRKCLYCDFCSFPGRTGDYQRYLEALKQELRLRWNPQWQVATIYIGGGTPTVLPPSALAELLREIKTVARVQPQAEVTVEANPGTIDGPGLAQLRAAGVNRLSVGAQSGDDRFLKILGRIHTTADVESTVALARRAGFTNINLDLIYGLPGETLDDWQQTLRWAIALAPDHLSCYGLQVEPGTPLQSMVREGRVRLPTDDEVSAMFMANTRILPAAGYKQYEISNFARRPRAGEAASGDYRCRHNLIYWRYQDYLGLGLAAVSTVAGHRWVNLDNLEAYLSAVAAGTEPTGMVEPLTPRQAMAEMLILGFRLTTGPDPEAFASRWGVSLAQVLGERVQPLLDGGFLREAAGTYRLTPRGMLVSNQVLTKLLAPLL